MIKEKLKYVDKVWGEEIWIVNCPEYCGKLLLLEDGARSSYHYHKKKKETFSSIEGYARLVIEGKSYLLTPFTRPKTIEPNEAHFFEGLTNCVILEVSTHHEEEDVVRLTESIPGHGGNEFDRVAGKV